MSSSSPRPAVSDKTSDTCLSRLRAAQLGDRPLRTVTGVVPKESALEDRVERTVEISLTLSTTENHTHWNQWLQKQTESAPCFQVLLRFLRESLKGLGETKQFRFTTSPCKKVSKFQWPGFIYFWLFRFEWSYTDLQQVPLKPFLSHWVSSPSSWAHGFCMISIWSHHLVPKIPRQAWKPQDSLNKSEVNLLVCNETLKPRSSPRCSHVCIFKFIIWFKSFSFTFIFLFFILSIFSLGYSCFTLLC